MIALLLCGFAPAAEVQLDDGVVRVDGLAVLDAVKQRTGQGAVAWSFVRDGEKVLEIERVRGLDGRVLLTATLHPELDRFQGNFQGEEEALLTEFVNERVLVWGVPDRDAFARYAEQRKLPLTNLNDRSREVVFHLENRCPRDTRLMLTSKRGTGQTANWQHSQPPESSTRLDLLTGDRICIDHPSGVCVTVVPENAGVAIAADCAGLVLQGR